MPDGCHNNAFGSCSEAEGKNTTASGPTSHAEGFQTFASGNASHAEGELTITIGEASHAEGFQTIAFGVTSHSEGFQTLASANSSHAEGELTTANGEASHAEGFHTEASGNASHAEGEGNVASGEASHAEGGGVDPLGNPAPNLASGYSSHAEGVGTTASGFAAHAEGGSFDITSNPGPIASGAFSHAEGHSTIASSLAAHAEGFGTQASSLAAHAEGQFTVASGDISHAEGFGTRANGPLSHTEGLGTGASGLQGVHVMGKNGAPNPAVDLDFSWYLVNGPVSYSTAGVVAKILSNGSACFDATVTASAFNPAAGACDFAEMFESSNGEPIDVGYFVTLDGASEKIRKATASDDYILGVTSSNPGVLADTEDPACGKFLLDKWNRKQYKDVVHPAITDEKGNIILAERIERQPILNPLWEPEKPCRSRMERPEWAAVGLVGKLLVRDDGSSVAGGYCMPNDDGIATNSQAGYRVLKRTDIDQILILFR